MPDGDGDAANRTAGGSSQIPSSHATAGQPAPSSKWLFVIVTIAVLLRVGFDVVRPSPLRSLPDQLEYLQLGAHLRQSGELYLVSGGSGVDRYLAYRMPGYPLLVAACNANVRTIQVVQALLDGSTCVAVYLIGKRVGRGTVGLLAAAAVSFNPYLIFFASLVLSETLFTALLIWGIYLLTDELRARRWAGVFLLLATVYVRPSAIGLGLVAAGVVLQIGATAGRRIASAATHAALAGLLLVLLLLPWVIRNQARLGTPVWTTTNDGFTAYDSFNPDANGSSNQAVFRGWLSTRAFSGEVEQSRFLQRAAWAYARAHPARDVQLAFAKLGRFWSPAPLSSEFGSNPVYVVIGLLYCGPLFLLAIVGVWRGGLGRRTTFLLLLPALYFSAVHCIAVGSLRYRVPCDVPLTLLAAAGASTLVRRPRVVSA